MNMMTKIKEPIFSNKRPSIYYQKGKSSKNNLLKHFSKMNGCLTTIWIESQYRLLINFLIIFGKYFLIFIKVIK